MFGNSGTAGLAPPAFPGPFRRCYVEASNVLIVAIAVNSLGTVCAASSASRSPKRSVCRHGNRPTTRTASSSTICVLDTAGTAAMRSSPISNIPTYRHQPSRRTGHPEHGREPKDLRRKPNLERRLCSGTDHVGPVHRDPTTTRPTQSHPSPSGDRADRAAASTRHPRRRLTVRHHQDRRPSAQLVGRSQSTNPLRTARATSEIPGVSR